MAPRKNELVTNWLAAYCGDEQHLFRAAIESIKHRRSVETENGWPMIDFDSAAYEFLQRQGPMRIENLAPTPSSATVATTIETGGIRATLEIISEFEFYFRGFLVDLSTEIAFARRVLNYIKDYGTIAADTSSDEEANKVARRFDQFDKTPFYAGTASVSATTFVAEVTFSDFACFELHGIVSSKTDPDWSVKLLVELRKFLEQLSQPE